VSSISRYSRTVVHTALAVLVVTALSRCSWEESRELAQHVSVLVQHRLALPSPVQAPVHDCDRESGCICRGATQVVAISPPQGQADLTDLLPPPASEYIGTGLSNLIADGRCEIADLAFAPPISGRQLRALYASLVI
jgi:hypothetical protein